MTIGAPGLLGKNRYVARQGEIPNKDYYQGQAGIWDIAILGQLLFRMESP